MTCRDEVLAAMERLEKRTGQTGIPLAEIVREVLSRGEYKESTIRTHITSSMCVNAPANHPTRYSDLQRLERGIYRRL